VARNFRVTHKLLYAAIDTKKNNQENTDRNIHLPLDRGDRFPGIY